jgi:hypothetical protein
MRAKCVFLGQLDRDLAREAIVKPARNVNVCELIELGLGCFPQFAGFARDVGLLRIGL